MIIDTSCSGGQRTGTRSYEDLISKEFSEVFIMEEFGVEVAYVTVKGIVDDQK